MLTLQTAYRSVFFLFLFICAPLHVYSDNCAQSPVYMKACKHIKLKPCKKVNSFTYYLYIEDFINSFIEIPTSNVLADSTTISSSYLAGRASVYNKQNKKVGTCSASFLCIQNQGGIYTDISNYLSVDSGLVVTWFTPTTLINLELDSIVHSMVTECIVKANTKVWL